MPSEDGSRAPLSQGGGATGAPATGGGYEYQSHRQMDRLEDDLRSGDRD